MPLTNVGIVKEFVFMNDSRYVKAHEWSHGCLVEALLGEIGDSEIDIILE
jgi:hypothetical protein